MANPTGGADLGVDWRMLISIADDEEGPPIDMDVVSLENAVYTINEGDSSVTYTMTRTGGVEGVVSVDVVFEDGSALFGSDYSVINQSYTATFQDGESEVTGVVIIIDDLTVELEESLIVRLSNPQGRVALGSNVGSFIVIADNDGGDSNNSGGGALTLILLGLLLIPVIKRRSSGV